MPERETHKRSRLREQDEYIDQIRRTLSELGISYKELSKGTELSHSMIKKYFSGCAFPSSEKRMKIEGFLKSARYYDGYTHKGPEEFSDFFDKVLNNLSPKIREQDLCSVLGMSQPSISHLRNSHKPMTTKKQYEILSALDEFYRDIKGCSLFKDPMLTCDYDSFLSYNDDIDDLDIQWTEDELEELQESTESCLEAEDLFNHLQLWSQQCVLAHPRAFFDNYDSYKDGLYFYSFYEHHILLEQYRRRLDTYEKKLLLSVLEEVPYARWGGSETEMLHFRQITELREMVEISSDHKLKQFVRRDQKYKTDQKIMDEFSTAFSHLFETEFCEELTCKLAMNSDEWYFWMLLVNACYYDSTMQTPNDQTIYKKISDMMLCPEEFERFLENADTLIV